MSRPHRTERGQATPLIAVVLVLAGLLLIPTGLLVRAAVERAEAQSAADAAALAGALEGEAAARRIAADNDADLIAFTARDDTVEVTVVVGDRRATARAQRTERSSDHGR